MGTRRRLSFVSELLWLVSGRRRLYRVAGLSMAPGLCPGDVVGIDTCPGGLPSPGDVVVIRDPQRPGQKLIKRARSRGERTFAVGSDAPCDARDSRHFGSLSGEHVVGRALWAWSPARGFRVVNAVG